MTATSEAPARVRGVVPEFGLGDRIRKAVEVSGLPMQEVADFLEVHRNQLGRWIHGHNAPSVLHVRAIAALTGVDVTWLRWGTTEPPEGSRASSSMAELRTFNPKSDGSNRRGGFLRAIDVDLSAGLAAAA